MVFFVMFEKSNVSNVVSPRHSMLPLRKELKLWDHIKHKLPNDNSIQVSSYGKPALEVTYV